MRAVDGESLFVVHAEAVSFLRILGEIVDRYRLELHAFCLMTTHYHLLVLDVEASASEAMRDLNGRYARWVNRRRGRRGALFDGRFRETPVLDDSHFLSCVRYLALNPVDAGLCERAADWRWSSHRSHAGLISPPTYLRTDTVIGMLGSTHAYVRFVDGDTL